MKVKAIILAALLVTGCQQNNRMTQKEEANKQWAMARATVLAGLARDQYTQGNIDKSVETVDEAIKLDPKNATLHVLRAKLAIEQGQLDLADREVKNARQLDAKNAEADYLAGIIYQHWQRTSDALTSYASASQKNPQELAYVLAQSEMLVSLDRNDEALALLISKLQSFEHSAPLRDVIGQLYIQQRKFDKAADSLHQACILDTEDTSIREHYVQALFRCGRYAEARDNLDRLIKDTKRADLVMLHGDCLLHLNKFHDARGDFERAVQLDPKQPTAWMNLARIALESNEYDRADRDLRRAISLEPSNADAYLLQGYIRLKQNKLSDAVGAFRKSVAINPSDSVATSMIGYCLQKQGHGAEAANYYGKALKQNPKDDFAAGLLAGVNPNE